MSGCSTSVEPGDTITWVDRFDQQLSQVVVSVQEGTAHGCLYVGLLGSVWDWEVTAVNGVQVT